MNKWQLMVLGLMLVSGSLSATISSFTLSHPGLTLQQRGQWYRLSFGQLPEATRGEITKLYWKLSFLTSPPTPLNLLLCQGSVCRGLKGVEGNSDLFRGEKLHSQWYLLVQLTGSGRQAPAVVVTAAQLTINSRTVGNKQGPWPLY